MDTSSWRGTYLRTGPPLLLPYHSTHGVNDKFIKILVGKPKGKRSLGRPRLRLKDNISVGLQCVSVWTCGQDSSDSGQDKKRALVNTVMNLRIPYRRAISWLDE